MSWIDLVVLAILLLSALVGLARGCVREVLGLAAWIAAAVLATRLYGQFLPLSRRLIGNDTVADPAAFMGVFVALLVVFLLLTAVLGRLVRGSVLGGLDRLAGLLFGVLRGFALLVIAYLLAVPVFPVAEWPQALRDGRSLPYIAQGAAWVAARLPDRLRPDLPASTPAADRAA